MKNTIISILLFMSMVNRSTAQNKEENFHTISLTPTLRFADYDLKQAENSGANNQINDLIDLAKLKCKKEQSNAQKYIDSIVEKLVISSNLEERLHNRYGVCVKVDSKSTDAQEIQIYPGGTIYVPGAVITKASNEAELAFVLGHELGHHFLHHLPRYFYARVNIIGKELTLYKGVEYDHDTKLEYRRQQEYESDRFGLFLLLNAGYDLNSSLNMVKKMSKGINTAGGEHPAKRNRVRALKIHIKDIKDSRPIIRDNYGQGAPYKLRIRNYRGEIPSEIKEEVQRAKSEE